jgi:S1-C subfamily serine protease
MMHTLRLPLGSILVLVAGVVGTAGAQEPSSITVVSAMERVLVDAIAKSEKSVVAVARVEKARPGETPNFEFRPDPFGRRALPAPEPAPTDPEFIPSEFGTGVVIDAHGLILTAYHVLGEDSEYFITTHDRKVYRAWIKAADPRSDLAVLAIDATDLIPIHFGDASSLQKGQIVVSLGNPYAIARDGQVSASWGIVSNLARKAVPVPDEPETSGKTTLHHFGTLIQTDAKLNLGTSGGPLLNLKGEMVGLVTSLAAAAGYEQAAGYAFPVDETFRRVVDQLREGREVEYGYLGIQPANLTQDEILRGLHGTRVHRIVPGSPAERFGLKTGDLITGVNGVPIYDPDGLVLEVGRLPVESVVHLAVVRGQRETDIKVGLTKYPVRGKKVVTTPAPGWRGMRIDYASMAGEQEGRDRGQLPFYDEGVLVSDVEEGTPAWEAGLRRGMLISQVEQTAVHSPAEFREAVASKQGPVELRAASENADPAVRTVPAGS